ncbi:hypothetical protein [Stenoxybacter acetivorans]|uniref:hypothetical protein n=1 Tax=Stenoxybacter acetivorans TaxID=422441 RepID=UPI0012EC3AEC|nr:hypothetical protein [Stenoxybacter acetivorans]
MCKSVNHPGSQILARPYLPIKTNGKLQLNAKSWSCHLWQGSINIAGKFQANAKNHLLDATVTVLKKGL